MHQCLNFILFEVTLHVSGGLSVHHQEFNTVHTATGISQTDTADFLLASSWQYLFDIRLLLYVQYWTPDDGRKDRPKHVEWLQITYNWDIDASSCFYYRKAVSDIWWSPWRRNTFTCADVYKHTSKLRDWERATKPRQPQCFPKNFSLTWPVVSF